ncbi:hypothetical protein WICPIJ_005210 [Wickerhamomyces pijperi]|uniref:Uncharacterized protein n=1 Tax=Wickerhamomyces pijperi TaxID=599730 RepID=A0A9P8TM21_WICPI|nr:hypothetical protein WICPIJ_005210 [Wickerhamomyces pijperi]
MEQRHPQVVQFLLAIEAAESTTPMLTDDESTELDTISEEPVLSSWDSESIEGCFREEISGKAPLGLTSGLILRPLPLFAAARLAAFT